MTRHLSLSISLCLLGLFIWGTSWPTIAQTDACPIVEQAAIAETRLWCREVQANELCYGNALVGIATHEAYTGPVDFDAPGDKLPVNAIAALNSTIGDVAWGVVIANLFAYPADSWAQRDAAMVILGDVQLINRGQETISQFTQDVTVNTAQGVNIRSGPNTDFRIIARAMQDDTLKATGRLVDDTWIRVQLRNGARGWLISGAVQEDTRYLPIVRPDAPALDTIYRPLQAFSLRSAAQPGCLQAPDSGVLLQTPVQAEPLEFEINGVRLYLAGTVFVQAISQSVSQSIEQSTETGLIINLLEGTAEAQPFGTRYPLDEGYRLIQPLIPDADGLRPLSGTQPTIEPYDYPRLTNLPIDLLPRLAYFGVDLNTIIRPRPADGNSPLSTMLTTDRCRITVGEGGVNLRSGPGTDYPIRGVINFRESAAPLGRTVGTDGMNWWQLALDVWIRTDTTVIGGNCAAVPEVPAPPPPPIPTPEAP